MKTLLILLLVVALAAAAFFTKPTQDGFKTYIQQQQNTQGLAGIISAIGTNGYLGSVVFHNHIFWMTVEKDGQRQYIGAFNHWFKSGAASGQAAMGS